MARSFVKLLDRHSPFNAASVGFSLVELLISAVIGGMIISAATAVIVSHIRSSAQQEAVVIRLQDHWARISLMLNNEIAEAEFASTGGTACFGATPQLSLSVPSGTPIPGVISYAVDDDKVLWRCGPTVLKDGSLDFTTASTSRLVEGATLNAVVDADGRLTTYTLALADPNGATYSNSVNAKPSRVRVIN